MRLIDADKLYPDRLTKTGELAISQSQIAEAQTVKITEEQAIDKLHETGWLPRHDKEMTRPTEVNCSHCDYFKFSKSFIENVANFMADYKIETVEDLMTELNRINEWLGGKDNE